MDIRRLIFRVVLCSLVLALIMLDVRVYAQADLALPVPVTRLALSTPFDPPLLKGIRVFPDDPFRFYFLFDKGDVKNALPSPRVLIKYFFAALTIPENDLWVNLSPYEKERMIPEAFGQTQMGHDLLAQDYILKQITASVINPEGEIGKVFWAKVYAEVQKRYGTTDIPLDAFNKVWIVPEKATVYENRDAAYVVESRLKVMLDSDYLALENNLMPAMLPSSLSADAKAIQGADRRHYQEMLHVGDGPRVIPHMGELAKNILREVIIPILEKDVNEGKNFSQLRQVYHSLILATWYKRKVNAGIMRQAYVDQKKTGGIDIADKRENEKIWVQYVHAFSKGAFSLIKEEFDPVTREVNTWNYFSGGASLDVTQVFQITHSLMSGNIDNAAVIEVRGVLLKKDFNSNAKPDRVFRIKHTGQTDRVASLRIQEVHNLELSPDELRMLIDKIRTNPDTKCVFLKKEIIEQATGSRHRVRLDRNMGIIPEGLTGKDIGISRTSSVILDNPQSTSLDKLQASEYISVKAGGYYRIKIIDPDLGELFFLTINPDELGTGELLLSPLGGGIKFHKLWDSLDVLLLTDENDIKLIMERSTLQELVRFFNESLDRELNSLRELLEEAVGKNSQLGLFDDIPQSQQSYNYKRLKVVLGPEVLKSSLEESLHESYVKAIMEVENNDALVELLMSLSKATQALLGEEFIKTPYEVLERIKVLVGGYDRADVDRQVQEALKRDAAALADKGGVYLNP
ncbi:MAG: hypothetical protein V2A70_09970, partial [Candidatus Omnitrophota bacterium]